jgi:sugar phosphate permease
MVEVAVVIEQQTETIPNSFYKWLVLCLATFTQASSTLVTYGVGPLAYFWQELFHLSQTETGLLFSAVNIGPLFFMLFVGRLLDRSNERLLIGFGSVLLGLTLLVVMASDDFSKLILVLFFVGVFYSTSQPGGSKVIMKWFPKKQRGLAMGIRQAGIPVGGALAGAIIPAISFSFGWHSAVLVLSCLSVIGGLAFLIFYREPSIETSLRSAKNDQLFRSQLINIIKNYELYPIFLTGITMISLQLIIVGHLTIFFTTIRSIPPSTAGLLFSITLCFGMIGRVLLAAASDTIFKGDRRTPLFLSVIAAFLSVLMFSMAADTLPFWSLCLLCAWSGFFGIGWYSLFLVEIAEKSARDAVGVTVSFALTLNQIAIIAAPPVFGLFVDMNGYSFAWTALAFFLLLSVFGLVKEKKDS